MKCKHEVEGCCEILKEAVEDQCDGCSFYEEDEQEEIARKALSEAVDIIEQQKAEIDELNRVILSQRSKLSDLEKKVVSYEFKAKIFDAVVKGIK